MIFKIFFYVFCEYCLLYNKKNWIIKKSFYIKIWKRLFNIKFIIFSYVLIIRLIYEENILKTTFFFHYFFLNKRRYTSQKFSSSKIMKNISTVYFYMSIFVILNYLNAFIWIKLTYVFFFSWILIIKVFFIWIFMIDYTF